MVAYANLNSSDVLTLAQSRAKWVGCGGYVCCPAQCIIESALKAICFIPAIACADCDYYNCGGLAARAVDQTGREIAAREKSPENRCDLFWKAYYCTHDCKGQPIPRWTEPPMQVGSDYLDGYLLSQFTFPKERPKDQVMIG